MNLDSYIDKLNHPIMGKFEDFKESSDVFNDWIIQRKWDGFRCLLDTNSRMENDLTSKGQRKQLLNDHGSFKDSQFPEIVKSIDDQCRVDCVLDGEMVVIPSKYDSYHDYEEFDQNWKVPNDFPNLMSRQATKNNIMVKLLSSKYPATYVAFDILKFEGEDCRELPLEDRLHLLRMVVKPKTYGKIRVISEFHRELPSKLKKICLESGYEGVVLKPKGKNYFAETIKLKAWQESEFKITAVDSTGSRLISTITVDCENPTNVKYNGEQTVARRDSLIGKIAEIRYLQPVKAGGKLRFPNLLRIIP